MQVQPFPAAAHTNRQVDDRAVCEREVCRLLAIGQRKVYRLALSFVRSPSDAEDLAQEAFVRVWHAPPLYDGRASFSTWIYAITRNACLSELRRRRYRRVEPLDGTAPERSVVASSTWDSRLECAALVETLSERQRQIVTLFYLEERSYEEVARMLDMPVTTVRSHLHRARRQMALLRRSGT